MDKILQMILSLSSRDSDLKELHLTLTKDEDTILKGNARCYDLLARLDPQQHSLGFVHILHAKALTVGNTVPQFIDATKMFIELGNGKQIKMAGPKFAAICCKFAEILIESGDPKFAIRPLNVAIKKLMPTTESLTPMHTLLVQCCLMSKCLSSALPFLEQDILNAEKELTGVTPKDMLLYFYYGAMVFIGLKRFSKALEFLNMLYTVPAHAVSAIMIEAYKKYVLVCLLVEGTSQPLPRVTPGLVNRHVKALCIPYNELATAYATSSMEDVSKVVSTHAEAFNKDENFGLVKQVVQSLFKRNIQKLTQTYLTLSLKAIAEHVGLTDVKVAEQLVLQMIEDGEIFATINQRDGMVEFNEDPEQYNTNRTLELLDDEIKKCITLSIKLNSVDQKIALSKTYIYKTQVANQRGPGGGFDDDMFGDMGGGKR